MKQVWAKIEFETGNAEEDEIANIEMKMKTTTKVIVVVILEVELKVEIKIKAEVMKTLILMKIDYEY